MYDSHPESKDGWHTSTLLADFVWNTFFPPTVETCHQVIFHFFTHFNQFLGGMQMGGDGNSEDDG
jgi:hypothetical protein